MKNQRLFVLPRMSIGYGHFYIFDQSENSHGCEWEPDHLAQGFVRRSHSVAVGTLLEYGHAHVQGFVGLYMGKSIHQRVFEIPIHLTTGNLIVKGPEEVALMATAALNSGFYRICIAQTLKSQKEIDLELYFQQIYDWPSQSRILVADEHLSPPTPLLETGNAAQF